MIKNKNFVLNTCCLIFVVLLPGHFAHLRCSAFNVLSDFREKWDGLKAAAWNPHTQHWWCFSYLAFRSAPVKDRYLTWWQHIALKLVVACFLSLCPVLCLCLSLTHTHTSNIPLWGEHMLQNRTVLSSSVFCCFDECSDVFPEARSEVSSPHTHTHTAISEGVWDRLGEFFSTRLGLNMSCLLRGSLLHHHPVHTGLLENPLAGLPLCLLIVKQKLLNRVMLKVLVQKIRIQEWDLFWLQLLTQIH